ncbi:MAG: hypothetical protein AB1Z19_04010 [Eubacteriales bacterium]
MSVSGIDQTYLLQQLGGTSTKSTLSANLFSKMLFDEMKAGANSENAEAQADQDGFSGLLSDATKVNGEVLLNLLSLSIGGESLFSEALASLIGTDATSNPLGSSYAYGATNGTYSTSGIPAEPWKPVMPSLTSHAGNRSARQYAQVINQFDVEKNKRYAPCGDKTYCNIFVWDVTRAMGAEIPHYFNVKNGAPKAYGDSDANQMSANGMCNWLKKHGQDYGWHRVSASKAQSLANQGKPVVTAWKNNGGKGHVQMVCPSADGRYNAARGVTVAQAGSTLSRYTPITSIFKKSLPEVVYYAHS